MMYELLQKARRGGMLTIEGDVEKPDESPIFQPYPEFLKNHHLRDFVCDTMRMVITGGVDAFDMDQMMDLDMEVQHHSEEEPVTALATMADSLPGLGIVAAVLGVVITMGALGGPAEEIGHKVAAALVGTFLGILLCYGLVGPVAQNMAKATAEEHAYLYVLRVLILAFIRGQPPVVAIEMGRRAIPVHVRPPLWRWKRRAATSLRQLRPKPKRQRKGRDGASKPIIVDQEERRPRRPSWRRMEGGLCRLRHRDDVAVHRAVADEHQREGAPGGGGILQRSRGARRRETGTDQSRTSENLALTKKNIPELKKKIEEAIRQMNDLKALQNQIQITITPEGLRIELLETKDGTFFDSGSAALNNNGRELLEMLAGQLGDLPNRISIEGHTDAAPYASKDGYGNWDLSTDRANAARRVMQASGLRSNQVSQVRGYADQKAARAERIPWIPRTGESR